MIYYKYIYTFTDDSDKSCTVSIVDKCEDAKYNTSLANTKLLVSQQIYTLYKKLFQGVEQTSIINLTQYNTLVKGTDELEAIPDWDPNLENTQTNEEPI